MTVTDPTATGDTDTGTGTAWSVRDGLATLDEPAVLLKAALDAVFTRWGAEAGARQQSYPPLLRAEDLRSLDYFRNFPHLGSPVTRIRPDRLTALAADQPGATALPALPAADLADATHLLPSAACYGCLLHLSGSSSDAPVLVTTVAQCFRHEDHHDGLRRLWGFTMREIVCVGSADAVRAHLDRHRERIATFGAALGLTLDRQPATDPFFEKDGARTVMQLLAPVKEEYLHTDGTAIASTNNHRNFFGERRGIRHAGRPAFSGCVAFGLERWVHALGDRFEGDLGAALRAVQRAGAGS
ncbi:hypothetical protein [Kitasatospora viridis]|uniref:tRNA synthetase class II (G, H, P, S and T) n=1 Tax=Kitasatospora viridis TaxID=281105 RepID=A0A561TSE6_9ACTN|nr:hypothetical protein [Kitasatospora viridis]TWF90034.1 hypothetical protein FHX73_1378 [Kitasatospora viridis]